MNTSLHKGSKSFIGYIDESPVCFFSVLHFPHPKVKNFKRGHRLVVLPDYQGLSIGHVFSSRIAQKFKDDGFRFRITSSTKALFYQRSRDPKWAVVGKARHTTPSDTSSRNLGKFGSQNKITYSYEYLG